MLRIKALVSLATAALLVGALAGPALASDPRGKPGGAGPTTITWTGQGATGGALKSEICPSSDTMPAGIDPDSYLHWVFTSGGGSAVSDPPPTLTLGGTGSGTYGASKVTGGAFHFFTPYFTPDPAMLSAKASFTILKTGRGAWNLVIGNGCPGGGGQGVDLTITKTANPTFTRTYTWDISKAVDKTLVEQFGGTATFNYTVHEWQTGFVDSDWAVTGNITVSNPNDWQDVTLTNLADAVDNGGVCTVDAGPYTVPAGSSIDVGYACAYASAPTSSNGTNTATATWDPAAYSTPNGSAVGTADFEFTTPTTTVNKTVTITDTFSGATTALGTLTATDAAQYAAATFTYARTVNVPAWDCVGYDNTARIVETGRSASQAVMACGPAKTGALTMGFWQNKNGQGIIQTAGPSTGVCDSTPWLRQYAPFQDLSAAATCSQDAIYVTNVIKAANSSGASMNAMLKGQMLATALDVYFSSPALGGNMINAPAPIGGVAIDLTRICTDLTCTSFEDSSSAFGGTPKTINEMLAYAASQSNVGGSMWYANVTATQELARDAFDAINNAMTFGP